MSNNRLSGRIAVVTGASKGIGAAIATSLAAEGASVVVNYASSREGADRVVSKIKEAGGNAIAVQADVSKPEDIERLFAETESTFGVADILVNNAGVYEFAPIEAITVEHINRQFGLNVTGLLLTTQRAVASLGDKGGSIINISSVVATLAPAAGTVYSATKGAVDTISMALSKELGPRGIRVNSLSPGVVETEGAHAAGFIGSDFQVGAVAGTPLGRIGQPIDIASVAVFLASNESGWITGQIINASGGAR